MDFGKIFSGIGAFFMDNVVNVILKIRIVDIVDILLLTLLIYFVYRFIRNRRAGKLALGLFLIILMMFVSNAFNMRAVNFILQNFYQVGILAIIIVFQPELRAALEKVGNNSIISGVKQITYGEQKQNQAQFNAAISSICTATFDMSKTKTGALIVIERTTKLGEYIDSGLVINARMSSGLIKNIFFKNAPLHDGAMIIRDMRVYAAGCFLRISERDDIDSDLGTRHRAALGVSEVSDAIVIVVSEETGKVSLAYDGNIKRGYTKEALRKELLRLLSPNVVTPIKPRSQKEGKKHE
jgi:diadenylate cyclase